MPIIVIITWSGGATDAMLELRLGACRGGTAGLPQVPLPRVRSAVQ